MNTAQQVLVAQKYNIPQEIIEFIEIGFLDILSASWPEKTIEMHLPLKKTINSQGKVTSYVVTWIHPEFNKTLCHYYTNEPGDEPNFYVTEETTDSGGKTIDDLETIDDLVDWLESMKSADIY